ncbi:DUF1080 domain-containing protein [Flavobacterium weaverense]|uniref:Uncharacterized protein DUF1080 n=1 Tax=Flavobacterium weaverense TaxID=271156 RepID=A0A3L9ZXF4_9FLAO|nr:DUF1080 domain-containing protein [Flavobacterium weaverense]RMA75188.1 uncharacterized protein DUF1080 [Flavobacterium weaverense]
MNNLYRLILIAFLISSISTNAQKKINLFNEKDLTGWYAFEPKTGKHENASEVFFVEDKMIRLYGKDAGYLMSLENFENFQLTAEFRWNTDASFVRKSDNRNSGLMYLVPAETADELWPQGIQFQIKENATGDFILLQNVTLNVKGNKTIAGKSVESKFFKDAEKPVGEWNKIKITVKNGVVTQKLNGKLVNKGTQSSVKNGRILLQYEGFPIDFRRVSIKKCM